MTTTKHICEAVESGNESETEDPLEVPRVADRLKAGVAETWGFLGPKLTDGVTALVLVATLGKVWSDHTKWRGRAAMLDWFTIGALVMLGPVVSYFGVVAGCLYGVVCLGTSLVLGWKIMAICREIRVDAATKVAGILGVRLGIEGLKVVLKKLAVRGRVEESMAEDLADALTSDSLVGIYFFLGMFHADNIKTLFLDASRFARLSGGLVGPIGWMRARANSLLSFDWVNPWWLGNPMPEVRRAFAGHWINFNIFGFQPFLFLRRNSQRVVASGVVVLSGLLVWNFLPRRGADHARKGLHLRGPALWQKRIRELRRTQEAKSLAKGKGKNKGRAQAVRAVGARAKKVKANRAGRRDKSNNRNTTVSGDLHWYDDDQVRVYDPMNNVELDMILGSKEFKELYKRVRANGMAEQAMIYNSRTDQVVNFYGDFDGNHGDDQGDEYDDAYYEDRDYDEVYYQREESKGFYRSTTTKHEEYVSSNPFSATMSVGCTTSQEEACYDEDSRPEESTLGRDRLSLGKFKGGIALNGDDSISVVLISGRMILMKHFVDKVEGKIFKVKIGGTEYSVDKHEGCPLGNGGELLTYAQPRGLQGYRSSRLKLGVPTNGLNGAEVLLVRFGDDGPSEVSAGKWHDGSYSASTQPGWCGSAVMVFPAKGAATMVGVHRWGEGDDGLNGCEIFDDEAIKYFKRNPPHPTE